jgi:hypothetical protein
MAARESDTLRNTLITVLAHETQRAGLHIPLPSFPITSANFSRLADLLRNDRRVIQVLYDPDVRAAPVQTRAASQSSSTPDLRIEATYNATADAFTFPYESATDNYGKSVMVHEATHCILDDGCVVLTPQQNEAVAYLAQAQFLLAFPVDPEGNLGAALYNPVLPAALATAERIRTTPSPTRLCSPIAVSDLQPIIDSVNSNAAYIDASAAGELASAGLARQRSRRCQVSFPFPPPAVMTVGPSLDTLQERPIH